MKKKKLEFKKLSLSKEKVVRLNDAETEKVAGGCALSYSVPCNFTYECPSAYTICYDTRMTSCKETNQVTYCVPCTMPYGNC